MPPAAPDNKLPEHLICRFKIKRRLIIGILKTGSFHDDAAIVLIPFLQEMNVSRCHYRLAQFFAQLVDSAVDFFQRFFVGHRAIANHKLVISIGLYFQIIVETRNLFQAMFRFSSQHCLI